MFILVIMCSAVFPWLLGLLRSFRMRSVISYLAEDDGKEEHEVSGGWIARPGLRPDTVKIDKLGWVVKRWTARTAQYYLGLFGICARLAFAFFYGIFVGSIISAAATLPAIVRVANPGEPFSLLPEEEGILQGDCE
jgi:hypothetical protein